MVIVQHELFEIKRKRGRKVRFDLTGQRFGSLVVLRQAEHQKEHPCWECQCDCGRIMIAQSGNLRKGKTKSCGHRLPPGIAARNQCYAIRRHSAQIRGYVFSITIEQFTFLAGQPCFYCGIEPTQVHKHSRGDFIYNGIDRADNTLGYVIENCIPCCGECNMAKGNMSQSAFIQWLDRVTAHRSTVNTGHYRELELPIGNLRWLNR